MHDIRFIRDNPDAFDEGLGRRGLEPLASKLIELDEERRNAIAASQAAQEQRNALSKQIGRAKAAKDEARAKELMDEVARLKNDVPNLESLEAQSSNALDKILAELPNAPLSDVPLGKDEHDNAIHSSFASQRSKLETGQQHFELGEALKLMDFEAASRLSGSRFSVLKGQLARMERALGQFMLDMHVDQHGYTEVSPPYLVKDEALFGTGQLPKFEEDLFKVSSDYWLIPTAEVPLTNLVREQILPAQDLPLRMVALTPCFRAEAGSAGRDTRGMLRQHQFHKVELVSITTPDRSKDEHERMLSCAEAVLKALDVPYRVMLLCTGDMGFSSAKTYDIEVWMPGQQTYREISSCSNCLDFQARRMNARFREGEGKPQFVHTLNGSGVAVGRALIAVMENYQNPDGSIAVPDVLQPYMGGLKVIG